MTLLCSSSAESLSSSPEILLWWSISKCCYLTFSFTIHNKHFKIPSPLLPLSFSLSVYAETEIMGVIKHVSKLFCSSLLPHPKEGCCKSLSQPVLSTPAALGNTSEPGKPWAAWGTSGAKIAMPKKHLPFQSWLLFTALEPNNKTMTALHPFYAKYCHSTSSWKIFAISRRNNIIQDAWTPFSQEIENCFSFLCQSWTVAPHFCKHNLPHWGSCPPQSLLNFLPTHVTDLLIT